jgi:hypothetical protein
MKSLTDWRLKMFKIVKREEMTEGNVILNEIEAPKIARKAKPGQFVILKANEDGERIPLTMAETDAEKGTITVIYMIVGKSTSLFKTLQVGDAYQDIIGPLGKPTHIENVGNIVCVGGGNRMCGRWYGDRCFAPDHQGHERSRQPRHQHRRGPQQRFAYFGRQDESRFP